MKIIVISLLLLFYYISILSNSMAMGLRNNLKARTCRCKDVGPEKTGI